MIDVECTLISKEVTQDEIGNETINNIESIVPIIKVEDVFASEFYEAGQLGFKPNLKLRISSLNYDNQKLLKYMNNIYDIIRVDTPTTDEVALICERRIGNGNQ
ncbi:MAG: phage head-tail adapter protein [Clostridia bacterium]|nr:phage head-tail adapter protein [Clostridia bacterium]